MIEVYTEWSGNCTSVLPTLQKLRAEIEDDESMQFLSVSPSWLAGPFQQERSLPLTTPAAATTPVAPGPVSAWGR